MSSPTRRAAPASPTKQPASTSPSRTSTASPPKSPSRPTAIRPVPMDVDRESLRKKRAASPNRNDADDESEKSPAKSSLPTVAADAGSASIDDRPTKRLHGDNSVSGSTSTASSNHASSTSPPAKEAGSPAQSPKAPAAKPAAFTGFGAMSATSTFAAPSSSGFSGFAALANKPSVFGASSSSSTTATTSTTTRLTSTFGSGFGAFSTSTTSGTGGFSALAANAPTTSIFASASTSSLTNDARDNEDNNDDADNDAHGDGDGADAEPAVHFQPVVQLEQQQVVTGEEDEETVVSERAKLFLPDADGKPKERGIGSVKVNVRTLANGERRARVLMRADGVHNVLVNAPLLPGMSCNVSERVLQFGALVDGKLVIHTFRFKTAVPCLAIADAIRDNVPTAAVNGEGADCQESGSGEEEEEQVHGEEAV